MIYRPILINDMSSPVENTRKTFLEEENVKIKGKKGFVFSNYITEKERLKKLLEEKNNEKEKLLTESINLHNLDDRVLLGLIQQPQMRFKPRTDIERIVDTLASNNLIKGSEKYVLTKQLKNMNIGIPFIITPENLSNPLTRSTIQAKNSYLNNGICSNIQALESLPSVLNNQTTNLTNINNNTKTIQSVSNNEKESSMKTKPFTLMDLAVIRKNSIKETRERAKKRFNNKDAKKILKHLHVKTHFKGSTSLIFDKNLSIPQKYQGIIQAYNNLKTQGSSINIFQDINDFAIQRTKKAQISDLIKPNYKEDMFFPTSQNNFFKQDSDEVDFKLNYNPLIKFEENVVDYTKLRKAKHIFMKEDNAEDVNKAMKYPGLVKRLIKNKAKRGTSFKIYNQNDVVNNDENKKEEDKVVIDQETINKDEMDKIALKILHKCNYFHKKNKNNDVTHERRKGKTMGTNGMTVKEFEREYGLEFANNNNGQKFKSKFFMI